MTLRTKIANWGIGFFRKLGRKPGESELAVELSDHSINVRMVETDTEQRAWDDNLYRYGNVFIDGYANPIKPSVEYNEELEDPDTVDVEEGSAEDSDSHVELISSPRYRDYMRQDLIGQLLNPREQWRIIAYAVIGLALIMAINLVVTLSAAGVF